MDVAESYVFEATIEVHAIAPKDPASKAKTLHYSVVWLPSHLHDVMPSGPKPRVDAVVAEVPLSGAFQLSGGRYFLMLGKDLLKRAAVDVGDRVEVRFSIADQAFVDVPTPLSALIESEPALTAAWDALTPGRQRAYAHRVASAKRVPTIKKRVEEVRSWLEDPELYRRATGR